MSLPERALPALLALRTNYYARGPKRSPQQADSLERAWRGSRIISLRVQFALENKQNARRG